jgi:hypothetical protein
VKPADWSSIFFLHGNSLLDHPHRKKQGNDRDEHDRAADYQSYHYRGIHRFTS